MAYEAPIFAGYGTAGQVLTDNGAGILPSWQIPGTSPWVLIQTIAPPTSPSIDFNSIPNYTSYMLVINNIYITSTDYLLLTINSISSYVSSCYNIIPGGTNSNSSLNTSAIYLSGHSLAGPISGTYFLQAGPNSLNGSLQGQSNSSDGSPTINSYVVNGLALGDGRFPVVINSLSLFCSSSGTIDTTYGSVSLYGLSS